MGAWLREVALRLRFFFWTGEKDQDLPGWRCSRRQDGVGQVSTLVMLMEMGKDANAKRIVVLFQENLSRQVGTRH